MDTVIRKILNKNQINEPFVKLITHGIANEIYATPNFILRIPTDHPEANSDAFTESVAAPLAKVNGIKTPELVCFDNSYMILNKTYSIWERIHGFTLGEIDEYLQYCNTWKEIGFELGKLHTNIKNCDDPKGWLDNPDRDYTKDMIIKSLLNNDSKSLYLLELVESKYKDKTFSYKKCFVHGDTNEFNFLCTNNDQLLSIIDWGDAGWADPAIDFYMIPIDVIDNVLEGYSQIAGINVEYDFINRIILDKVWTGIEERQDLCILEKNIMKLESQLLKRL
ncbi:aminoglycoside phosphotransferase family protein [Alkaliphilus peptidifermentans]|uniref:Phosphotransferase enzyme family protein n=1 Tax=Alkaliphilus peptidifermentans DSM 18978 TaxID=1120976 RepID=A0A1G5LES4_9FIRM|nr:aminoglycoside phosphotransferase family protein [Alkaliphilus peptidifermentans]SCZ10798.1 Phosphotransferase enzyme family protein [Alkaliphilus peptidifermentans DSM 18978]